jgi:hypothetical protein
MARGPVGAEPPIPSPGIAERSVADGGLPGSIGTERPATIMKRRGAPVPSLAHHGTRPMPAPPPNKASLLR